MRGSSDCTTNRSLKPAELIDQIADQVLLAAKDAKIKPSKIHALGIGAPGAVDPEKGIVVKAPNLGWTNVALAKQLKKRIAANERRFGCRVRRKVGGGLRRLGLR